MLADRGLISLQSQISNLLKINLPCNSKFIEFQYKPLL